MASLKDTFSTIGGWFGDFVSLGLSLAMVFLVVDALFGVGTTGIVDNVADLVGAFTDNGLTGLMPSWSSCLYGAANRLTYGLS